MGSGEKTPRARPTGMPARDPSADVVATPRGSGRHARRAKHLFDSVRPAGDHESPVPWSQVAVRPHSVVADHSLEA